jgi:2-dehydropantoate 2-reductase
MLPDVESGRPLELEALLGSVRELGCITQTPTPTPNIDAVYARVLLLAQTLSHQGRRLAVSPR